MEMAPKKMKVLGIPVSTRDFILPKDLTASLADPSPVLVTFVNPHACYNAVKYPQYVSNLETHDWVLCDGIGMVKACNRLYRIGISRAAFDLTSVARPVFKCLSELATPVVMVGGKPGVATDAANIFTEIFPGLNVVATFHGYEDDPEKALAFVSSHPEVTIVCGMGAPRQEEFLIRAKSLHWNGVGFTCGGFFDQVLDRLDYYPRWVDKHDLRFAYRFLKEPNRLAKRYFVEYRVFLYRYLNKALNNDPSN